MRNFRADTYLLLAATFISLMIAVFCALVGNSMDIFFLGGAVILGGVTVGLFKKNREEKKLRSY